MTVDMVFAISHSHIMRERGRNRLERLKKGKSNKVVVNNKNINTELNIEKVKQYSCLEMFRLW
jgi:hypothetical protein